MKRLLPVVLAALITASAFALPAAASPETEFLVVRRLPNGNDIVLARFDWTGTSEDDARVRAIALDAARQNRTNNPAWLILIFGPTNGGDWTDDDIVWSSAHDL